MSIIPLISQKMKELLTDVAEAAADTSNLIERQVKITGSNLCQTLVFGWWQNPEATLNELCQMGKTLGLSITPQGLDQRWNEKLAAYLQIVLQQVVQLRLKGAHLSLPGMEQFSQVYVEDSSIVVLPESLSHVWQGLGGKGSTSAVKLQTRLNLKNGELDGPHLVDGRTSDQQAACQHERLPAGSLQLRDLGYWQLGGWAEAVTAKRYLLSRMKTSTHFWYDDQVWTSYQWCWQCPFDQFEIKIALGKKAKIPVRLIGYRVPAAVSAERRRKVKRAARVRGQTVTQERLDLCDWTLIVTNAPPEKMSRGDALRWLRVRWQIELLFKLWKSAGQIDKSRSANPWRILCELYAKLIAMTLQQWLFSATIWQYPNRSWTKAAQIIRMHVIRLATTLTDGSRLRETIVDIGRILASGSRINRSRKQVRTFHLLCEMEGDFA